MNNLFARLKSIFSGKQPKVETVLLAILVLVGAYWAYTNFAKPLKGGEEVKIEKQAADQGTNPEAVNSSGSIAGEKTGPESKGSGNKTVGQTMNSTSSTISQWTAREIGNDSLKSQKTYQVQSGDTLWEIAKGKYGSGFDWHKILDANKDKVGFLADGSQALIEVGTVLTLP